MSTPVLVVLQLTNCRDRGRGLVRNSRPERGVLQLEDPALAAAQFNWLIMSAPINQAMLLGHDEAPGPAELNRHADSGVRAFLAAYRAR